VANAHPTCGEPSRPGKIRCAFCNEPLRTPRPLASKWTLGEALAVLGSAGYLALRFWLIQADIEDRIAVDEVVEIPASGMHADFRPEATPHDRAVEVSVNPENAGRFHTTAPQRYEPGAARSRSGSLLAGRYVVEIVNPNPAPNRVRYQLALRLSLR
jgi:hypothetical protein